jgi:ABC-type Fe3+ transport system permease subunit
VRERTSAMIGSRYLSMLGMVRPRTYPAVVTPIVTAYLWRNLLGPNGAVNSLLAAMGLGSWQQDWLGDPQLALWSIVGVIVWLAASHGTGIAVLIAVLAVTQSHPCSWDFPQPASSGRSRSCPRRFATTRSLCRTIGA